ncbi:hypothetical protein OQA88_8068 [Cercophora sp. LCS_1]
MHAPRAWRARRERRARRNKAPKFTPVPFDKIPDRVIPNDVRAPKGLIEGLTPKEALKYLIDLKELKKKRAEQRSAKLDVDPKSEDFKKMEQIFFDMLEGKYGGHDSIQYILHTYFDEHERDLLLPVSKAEDRALWELQRRSTEVYKKLLSEKRWEDVRGKTGDELLVLNLTMLWFGLPVEPINIFAGNDGVLRKGLLDRGYEHEDVLDRWGDVPKEKRPEKRMRFLSHYTRRLFEWDGKRYEDPMLESYYAFSDVVQTVDRTARVLGEGDELSGTDDSVSDGEYQSDSDKYEKGPLPEQYLDWILASSEPGFDTGKFVDKLLKEINKKIDDLNEKKKSDDKADKELEKPETPAQQRLREKEEEGLTPEQRASNKEEKARIKEVNARTGALRDARIERFKADVAFLKNLVAQKKKEKEIEGDLKWLRDTCEAAHAVLDKHPQVETYRSAKGFETDRLPNPEGFVEGPGVLRGGELTLDLPAGVDVKSIGEIGKVMRRSSFRFSDFSSPFSQGGDDLWIPLYGFQGVVWFPVQSLNGFIDAVDRLLNFPEARAGLRYQVWILDRNKSYRNKRDQQALKASNGTTTVDISEALGDYQEDAAAHQWILNRLRGGVDNPASETDGEMPTATQAFEKAIFVAAGRHCRFPTTYEPGQTLPGRKSPIEKNERVLRLTLDWEQATNLRRPDVAYLRVPTKIPTELAGNYFDPAIRSAVRLLTPGRSKDHPGHPTMPDALIHIEGSNSPFGVPGGLFLAPTEHRMLHELWSSGEQVVTLIAETTKSEDLETQKTGSPDDHFSVIFPSSGVPLRADDDDEEPAPVLPQVRFQWLDADESTCIEALTWCILAAVDSALTTSNCDALEFIQAIIPGDKAFADGLCSDDVSIRWVAQKTAEFPKGRPDPEGLRRLRVYLNRARDGNMLRPSGFPPSIALLPNYRHREMWDQDGQMKFGATWSSGWTLDRMRQTSLPLLRTSANFDGTTFFIRQGHYKEGQSVAEELELNRPSFLITPNTTEEQWLSVARQIVDNDITVSAANLDDVRPGFGDEDRYPPWGLADFSQVSRDRYPDTVDQTDSSVDSWAQGRRIEVVGGGYVDDYSSSEEDAPYYAKEVDARKDSDDDNIKRGVKGGSSGSESDSPALETKPPPATTLPPVTSSTGASGAPLGAAPAPFSTSLGTTPIFGISPPAAAARPAPKSASHKVATGRVTKPAPKSTPIPPPTTTPAATAAEPIPAPVSATPNPATRFDILRQARERSYFYPESVTRDLGIPINAPPLEHILQPAAKHTPVVSLSVLTPSETRRLQRDYFSMRQLILKRMSECPYEHCNATFPYSEEGALQKHLNEVHSSMQYSCNFCDEPLFANWPFEERYRHYMEAHWDVWGALSTDPFDKNVELSWNNIPQRLLTAYEAQWRFCARCGRNHGVLDAKADRQLHDFWCRDVTEEYDPSKERYGYDRHQQDGFCGDCGQRKLFANVHKCEVIKVEGGAPYCQYCALHLGKFTPAYRRKHLSFCKKVGSTTWLCCPWCGGLSGNSEEAMDHILACDYQPKGVVFQPPEVPVVARGGEVAVATGADDTVLDTVIGDPMDLDKPVVVTGDGSGEPVDETAEKPEEEKARDWLWKPESESGLRFASDTGRATRGLWGEPVGLSRESEDDFGVEKPKDTEKRIADLLSERLARGYGKGEGLHDLLAKLGVPLPLDEKKGEETKSKSKKVRFKSPELSAQEKEDWDCLEARQKAAMAKRRLEKGR